MKISFTTICMNRLFHLKDTLPSNIEDTRDIDREFIILNYNSKDRMNEYLWNHFQKEIKSGLVKVYHTKSPKYFNFSHSKNIAAKQATGDIIVNIDADNFIVPGFSEWILEVFHKNIDSICRAESQRVPGVGGKIAISKWNVLKLKGYDEGLKGWGFDDIDLIRRATEAFELEYVPIPKRFFDVIQHNNRIRFENYKKGVLKKGVEATEGYDSGIFKDKELMLKFDGTHDFEKPDYDFSGKRTPLEKEYLEKVGWQPVPFLDCKYVPQETFDEYHKYPNHQSKLSQDKINLDGWGECKLERIFDRGK